MVNTNLENADSEKLDKPTKGINRKARLIVRNLSFKTTEKKLREYFGQYGEVDEVQLLKKPDGKLKGCAFIQYRATQMAAKALYNTNGKLFLEREIVTDWAVPKNKYVQQIEQPVEVKEEDLSDSENTAENSEIKVEAEVIEESEIKNEDKKDFKPTASEITDKTFEVESDEAESDEDAEAEDKDSDADDKSEIKSETTNDGKRPKVFSNDVTEGKTVFVKNLPFSATNEDLKQCMLQFGRVYYALICKDKFTEHSKGTGFVKFVEKEAADQCLQAGTELTLLGNILDCHPALDKKVITQKATSKDTKIRDTRNLYLIKEGVIVAGSPAAKGVSKSDMEKRLKLEQWKTQILKNLHMFVSKNRLVVHNVPESWDDSKLRQLFLKHGGTKPEILEARIMRDLRNVDNKGVGQSKGHGFITFKNHENALHALRSLNNNPNIFTPATRPIVAFSIENKLMVNAKQRRLEKSRQKNPLCKQFNYEDNGKNQNKQDRGVKRKFPFKEDRNENNNEKNSKREYTGITSKPGMSKLRSKFKLRAQAQVHHETLKKEKSLKRKKLQLLTQKQPIRQPKQKMNKRKQEKDDFSKLVNKYKSTLTANVVKKSKWYE
ncbi:RNA-binding protein 28 [Chrysoperla carnea]|uniref:RNA-binding protein 28 n=1 Tax=Chrysoperla carnea TaxID=189513 RepID=UPI001D08FC28|nr:RNA-binding protein 28 [Chrysoperla carnea]